MKKKKAIVKRKELTKEQKIAKVKDWRNVLENKMNHQEYLKKWR